MIRIGGILCPTDLTPESKGALRYALGLARAYEARLLVVHCLPSGEASEEKRIEIGRELEQSIAAYGSSDGKVAIETQVLSGDPLEAITECAAAQHIDLIVMRSRRRPHAAALLGSTAEAVCRTAPCSVLITHPDEREWSGLEEGEIGIKRILAAHDFSLDSEVALSLALSLAQEYQAEIHLCHVLPPRPPEAIFFHADPGEAFNQTSRRLAGAVSPEVYLWSKVKQVILEGQPYRELLEYSETNEIDLICMGVHGAGFGLRTLFGSNVDRVLRQAPCPVLVARPLKPAVGGAIGDGG